MVRVHRLGEVLKFSLTDLPPIAFSRQRKTVFTACQWRQATILLTFSLCHNHLLHYGRLKFCSLRYTTTYGIPGLQHSHTKSSTANIYRKLPSSLIKVHSGFYLCCDLRWTTTYIFLNLFIFLAVLGLHCCTRAFSSCVERGLLFVVVCRLLIAVASLIAEHGL